MRNFLSKKGYFQGVFFIIMMMSISCFNDVIAKYIGQRLDSMEIIFFRFFFSLISLLPFLFIRGIELLRTSQLPSHIIRGFLGVVSFYLYTYSIINMQLVEVVTILWSIPLFCLVLSVIFLKETVDVTRWFVTIVGFLGLAFVSLYDSDAFFSFKSIYIIPILAAFLFAVQDVMIKKMISKDDPITMLFYFSLVASILTFPGVLCVWKCPTVFEFCMLFLFGIFANLMQYFLFKAFEAADLSALAPYKYLEFLLSAIVGFVFFAEVPGCNVVIGACVLIPSTLYMAYSENNKKVEI